MKRNFFALRCGASALCCIALSSLPAIVQAQAAKGSPMTDQQFVDFAAQTDMVEANLGQQAENSGSGQGVKDLGQTLVSDHTSDYGQISNLAQAASLKVPTAIDTAHNKMMIDPFTKLKGEAFDKKFAAEMVAGHTKAIEIYKKEAKDAENASLKAYAEQTLPTLEKHLAAAKALESGKMESAKMESGKMEKPSAKSM